LLWQVPPHVVPNPMQSAELQHAVLGMHAPLHETKLVEHG
jgi:hypothetical protein